MKSWLGILGMVLLGACTDPSGVPGSSAWTEPLPVPGDAGVCARPEEGCACEPGSAPVECYLDPVEVDGVLTCNAGTRYCRAGAWTGCESLRSYTLGASEPGSARASLIDGPSACNPCNPDCSVARDYPSSGDLTPGNSSGVEYDPGAGGIIIGGGTTGGGTLDDGDGDGVPDAADECPGTGWRAPCDGDVTDDGFYHTLPFGGPAEIDPLSFDTRVTTADVYFLIDTTGSMGGEISNLRSSLTSGTLDSSCAEGRGGGIIGAIKCSIPGAEFGVGRHDDYPVCPSSWGPCYGGSSDVVYRNLQDISSSVGAAQTAVNGLSASGGADGPESQTQALWAMATGGGLNRFLSARSCGGGRWGWPCFRPDTIPIVILVTDAPFHNGPSGYTYDSRYFPSGTPIGWSSTVAALRARNVRVISIVSCGGQSWCRDAEPDGWNLANATGAVDDSLSGRPYMFPIRSDGGGLSTAVVDAVWALANNTRFDVTARPTDNPGTPIDERGFVDSIVANYYPPGRCASRSGATFYDCMPGTPLDYRVSFRNDFVMPTSVPQVFEFFIEVLMDGTVQQRVPVRITVPPDVPMYPDSGTYWRDYDATTRCEIPPQRPDWGTFTWDAVTSPDSSIAFDFRTADTAAGLATATPARVVVPPSTSPIDVGAVLVSSGLTNFKPYLRVTATLRASTDRTETPVLRGFELTFTCVSYE